MASIKPVLFHVINLVVFLATDAVNALAGNTKLLNGVTSGEISDIYPTLITPAIFIFSIWGIIYLLSLVFSIFQNIPKKRGTPLLKQINILFALKGLCNISWLLF